MASEFNLRHGSVGQISISRVTSVLSVIRAAPVFTFVIHGHSARVLIVSVERPILGIVIVVRSRPLTRRRRRFCPPLSPSEREVGVYNVTSQSLAGCWYSGEGDFFSVLTKNNQKRRER